MKKRTGIVIVALLLLGLIAWRIWFRPQKTVTQPEPAVVTAKQTVAKPLVPPTIESVSEDDLQRTPLKGTDEQKRVLIAQIREVMRQANQPITFYGQVVDQYNQPIPGVKVQLGVRYTEEVLPGFTDDRFRYFDEITDVAGLFALTDTKGAVLSVKALEKEGYETTPHAIGRSFWYWRDVPSHGYKAQNGQPEIFRMWKKSGAEKLITGDKFYGVVPDGRNYAIDLRGEKKIEGGKMGDFKISIHRPAQVSSESRYDWSCVVEGIGGGVIETQDEFMYYAPESGYQPHYEVTVAASDPKWSDRATRHLYLKSNDGKIYARLEVEIFANYQDKAVFSVKYYANTNGSRNLEYDPVQNVVKK